MGTAPIIYNRPQIAQYVNALVSPEDYVFIGPFDFEELFYLNTKRQPSRYHWFLNHAATSKIKRRVDSRSYEEPPESHSFSAGICPVGRGCIHV